MRVITGTARGRRLAELKGQETRPTTGKVKEAIFSALQFELEGRRVLDLFAGTGQMGIEALSRGAKSCLFVDRRQEACRLVRENLAACALAERAQVVCGDALSCLDGMQTRFDLIFLDPPYADDTLERALARIVRFDISAPYGIIVAECPTEKTLPPLEAPYRLSREYRYGKIKVTVYRRDGETKETEA
ncbi:MAG: 16S rRNA (guanine(966)-N(2))-methyltransferase RsmD [Oscillospiraceae bacterium]|nr:16S rRNA (guanine(966)-N(2))-methyltransferase RsmD [Oscillospiraceae bacterium]